MGQDTLEALETYLDVLPGSFKWMDLIRDMKIVIDQAGRVAACWMPRPYRRTYDRVSSL